MNTFKISNILFNIVIFYSIYVSETSEVMDDDCDMVYNLVNLRDTCDIYRDKCIYATHFSENNLTFFVQHSFTMDTTWKSVGKIIYCKSGTCHAEFTIKIEKSTQIEYSSMGDLRLKYGHGNKGNVKSITDSVIAGFSGMGIQFGVSNETSVQTLQSGGERSLIEVTNENGFTVLYSTSTANTVGVEEKITCDGVQNEKIFMQARTNMTRLRGNACEFLCISRLDENKRVFKCNYIDLKMYPVQNENIVTELQCNREIINS